MSENLAQTAAELRAALPDLLAKRDAAKSKRERKALSGRIRIARDLIKWIESRAGYRPPGASRVLK